MDKKILTYAEFGEKFNALSEEQQIEIFNKYRIACGMEIVMPFNKETINEKFTDVYEAMRAMYFGDIKSLDDKYITTDTAGDFVSLSPNDLRHLILDELDYIYEDESLWEDVITD